MIKEPFAIKTSWIHRINPCIRIVYAVLYSFVITLMQQFPTLLTALFISIFLVFLARLDLREICKRLTIVFWFLIFVWIFLPITFGGEILYNAIFFNISNQGVILSAQITLKTTAILFVFISLITTMRIYTLGYALNNLKLSNKLVHLLLMTYRYIFVIENEYRRILTAIKIRGFRSQTNIHSYKTYAYLIGMIFVRALIRAERVHQAMLCRGFKGKFYTLEKFDKQRKDYIFTLLSTISISFLIILENCF